MYHDAADVLDRFHIAGPERYVVLEQDEDMSRTTRTQERQTGQQDAPSSRLLCRDDEVVGGRLALRQSVVERRVPRPHDVQLLR